eukprot:Blabericola_migrator_1__10110@NODE_5615_length_719_cov_3_389571_g3657_i0_p1_GENE_NODE_5615_length_719_cov_3_389571_g3657_i0NODE_5615_length_719_cov_3_389571_g3657_i0_p1_ORF_typecomplete_len107_score0_51_NODE_5615_length_719_cov_3_389571_g3657_i0312632
MGDHERRWLLKTAGRWPWKSESAKECVTTHLPNQLALKMDGAKAPCLYPAAGRQGQVLFTEDRREAPASRRARRRARKGLGVSLPGAAAGADLGGSSKYSSEGLEG